MSDEMRRYALALTFWYRVGNGFWWSSWSSLAVLALCLVWGAPDGVVLVMVVVAIGSGVLFTLTRTYCQFLMERQHAYSGDSKRDD